MDLPGHDLKATSNNKRKALEDITNVNKKLARSSESSTSSFSSPNVGIQTRSIIFARSSWDINGYFNVYTQIKKLSSRLLGIKQLEIITEFSSSLQYTATERHAISYLNSISGRKITNEPSRLSREFKDFKFINLQDFFFYPHLAPAGSVDIQGQLQDAIHFSNESNWYKNRVKAFHAMMKKDESKFTPITSMIQKLLDSYKKKKVVFLVRRSSGAINVEVHLSFLKKIWPDPNTLSFTPTIQGTDESRICNHLKENAEYYEDALILTTGPDRLVRLEDHPELNQTLLGLKSCVFSVFNPGYMSSITLKDPINAVCRNNPLRGILFPIKIAPSVEDEGVKLSFRMAEAYSNDSNLHHLQDNTPGILQDSTEAAFQTAVKDLFGDTDIVFKHFANPVKSTEHICTTPRVCQSILIGNPCVVHGP